jgi:uncharacterized membrane protein
MAIFLSSNSFAWLKVCNNTSSKITVAVAFTYNDSQLPCTIGLRCPQVPYDISKGWFNIASGDCALPTDSSLQSNTVYIRAERNGRSILSNSKRTQYEICSDPKKAFYFRRQRDNTNYVSVSFNGVASHPLLGPRSCEGASSLVPLKYIEVPTDNATNFTFTIN